MIQAKSSNMKVGIQENCMAYTELEQRCHGSNASNWEKIPLDHKHV